MPSTLESTAAVRGSAAPSGRRMSMKKAPRSSDGTKPVGVFDSIQPDATATRPRNSALMIKSRRISNRTPET